MDFSFTEEQLMIRDVARRIAQSGSRRAPPALTRPGIPAREHPPAGRERADGDRGPAEYGGAGMDPISYVLAMFEVARPTARLDDHVGQQHAVLQRSAAAWHEEQKRKYVTPIATGQAIGAYALTEPQSGSDASAMRTRAVLADDGSHYVVNGKKSWITSGPVARYIMLFAMTDPDQGSRGISAFIIDTEREGFHRGKTEPKLGIRARHLRDRFSDYRCGERQRRRGTASWAA